MASPAAGAYSCLWPAARVCTAPRRRPASPFSPLGAPARVRLPRMAPRSLSMSLSALRPRVHRCDSDPESAPWSDPAVDHHYDVVDMDHRDETDADLLLGGPAVEEPRERAVTTDIGEDVDDEDHHDVVAMVLSNGTDALVLSGPAVEEPRELAPTTGIGEAVDDEDHHDVLAMVVSDGTDDLVLSGPAVEEPRELAPTTLHGEGSHDDVDDWGDLDDVVYPAGLTIGEIKEFKNTDFSRAAINERFRRESKEAKAAVIGAVTGVVRPLWELLGDLRSLKSVFDTQEFHIGMPFGAIMTCMGMYQLWKLSPSTCIEIAMYYAFYKLSDIAADVRRRGFSPDWIIRIKLGIIIALLVKYRSKSTVPLGDYIRVAIFMIYFFSVGCDVLGMKKYARMILPMVLEMAKHPMATTIQCKRVKATGEVEYCEVER
ncbi:hypothetical protein CFC21_072302 [Triticum aestivum]|uniref:Uncharacterized protein n=2 Tax=Triticum aestivum TaxID=4565 RepID=A0A3B6LPC5_WHEAT|nr:uncharacterized protein LOC123116442 [Triticum aestivum]KAF7066289.1 hypothetical protein CFC21_072302 [Triticum aestivum]